MAWSHSARFQMARELAAPRAGERLLDYGCGDGTFVAQVHDLFPLAMAVDVSMSQVQDCARRFNTLRGLTFAHVDAMDSLIVKWRGQVGVDLPGKLRASRAADVVRIAPVD